MHISMKGRKMTTAQPSPTTTECSAASTKPPLSDTKNLLKAPTKTSSSSNSRWHFSPTLVGVILVASLPGFVDNINTSVVNNTADGVAEWFAQNGAVVTRDMWSTFVSLQLMGSIFGSLITGPLVKWFGPRNGMIVNDLGYVVSAVIVAFCGNNFKLFCFAKFLMGISMGITIGTASMLVGECAPAHQRGGACMALLFVWMPGVPLAFALGMEKVMGNPDWWRVLYTMFSTLAVVHAVVAWFLPESPRYLMMVGKHDEARKSLMRLRSKKNVDEEFDEMKEAVESEVKPNYGQALKSLLLTRQYIRPLIVGFSLPFFVQFAGGLALSVFSKSLLVSLELGNAETSAILIGCLGLPVVLALTFVIDKYGRRNIMIYSWGAATISAIVFALCTIYRTPVTEWIALIDIFIFICFVMSPGTINMMIAIELFPTSVRPVAVSLCNVVARTATFASLKSFLYLVDAFGDCLFFFYAGVTILGALFVYFFVPETNGIDLEKAGELFDKTSISHDDAKNDAVGGEGDEVLGDGSVKAEKSSMVEELMSDGVVDVVVVESESQELGCSGERRAK